MDSPTASFHWETIPIADSPPTYPPTLAAALFEPIEFDGQRYEHGCAAYFDRYVNDSDIEGARVLLYQKYSSEVAARIFSDERW